MKKNEESMDKAMEALKTRNYAVAKRIFEEKAEEGNGLALYNLGIMYLNGYGMKADKDEGERLLLAASAKKSIDADYYLGVMYLEDPKAGPCQARTWLQKAANGPKGHPEARYMLGKLYEIGLTNVILKDESRAKEYFLAAANQGNQEAQLGVDYKKDLDSMFFGLWLKGAPLLSDQLFYNYKYEIYASLGDIPENEDNRFRFRISPQVPRLKRTPKQGNPSDLTSPSSATR